MEKKVEYEDVARVAISILLKGGYPSVDKVRAGLGDVGSKTTINDYLQQWREEVARRHSEGLPPEIPKELVGAFEQFWNTALELADSTYGPQRRAAEEKVAEADFARQTAERGLEEARARVDTLQGNLDRATTHNEEQAASIQALTERLTQAQLEVERIRQESAEAVEDAQRDRDAARDAASRDRAAAQEHAAGLQKRIEFEQERAQRQEDHWSRQVEAARAAEKRSDEAARVAAERLQDERATFTRQLGQKQDQLAERTAEVAVLGARLEGAEGALSEARTRIEMQAGEVLDLTGRLAAANARYEEAVRAHGAQVADLQSTIRDERAAREKLESQLVKPPEVPAKEANDGKA